MGKLRTILAEEGLLSDKQASRPPLDKKQIAEIEQDGWPDMMSQAEASDWAVNTIRQAWRERGMVGKPEQMMREEFDRIRKGNLDYLKYLRVSRAGSKFRIDRAMRRAIYIQYLAKNKKVKSELWRRLADKSKTAGDTGSPISNKDWAVDGKRIEKVCKDSGKFKKEFLDQMDWGKVMWKKPKPNQMFSGDGTMMEWYVFPKGEFNGKGDSIHGYIVTEWHVGQNAVEIQGNVVVKH